MKRHLVHTAPKGSTIKEAEERMKRVKITNTHGFTARTLRKEERKVKDASLC